MCRITYCVYDYQIITEKPFSPISRDSYYELLSVLEDVEYIIFCNFPIGIGNLRNLECLLEIEKKIIIYEETDIELRDFTDGKARKIYEQLKKRQNVRIFSEINEIFKYPSLSSVGFKYFLRLSFQTRPLSLT